MGNMKNIPTPQTNSQTRTNPLSSASQAQSTSTLQELEDKLKAEVKRLNTVRCEKSLAEFTKQAWHIVEPETKLVWNWHLDILCKYLEATTDVNGAKRINRLIINVPPGSLKSVLVSVMFPAWLWIKQPAKRVLGVSNAQDLAIRDSRRTKQIITDKWYTDQWPLNLKADQSAKTNYENEKGGFRVSLGMTANITGKRGDYILIDDPHDATTVQSDLQREAVIDTYDTKLSTRLNSQSDSVIILIMQRLHHLDLTGHLLNKVKTKWTHVIMPMHFDSSVTFDPCAINHLGPGNEKWKDPRKENELLFPTIFSKDVVQRLEEDLGSYAAAGQLEQRPSPKGGGILRQDWFKVWDKDTPFPVCNHIFISCDTAYSDKDVKNNSYSAFTTWGVFWNKLLERDCIILLDVWYDQVDYPDLRRRAKELWRDKKPDAFLLEKKASGQSLVQDLRQARVMVRTYTPNVDKIARAYAAQATLESGLVYVPDRNWAHQFTHLLSTFPTGVPESNDLTDTFTQAIIYIRNGWYVSHPDDEDEDIPEYSNYSAYGSRISDEHESTQNEMFH